MSRYINVGAFEKRLEEERKYLILREQYGAEHILVHHAMDILVEFPTADVVEVVRCKDCTRQMICFHSDDYFCADGERIEE